MFTRKVLGSFCFRSRSSRLPRIVKIVDRWPKCHNHSDANVNHVYLERLRSSGKKLCIHIPNQPATKPAAVMSSRDSKTQRKRPLSSPSSSQSSSTHTKRHKASVISASPRASPSSAVVRAAKSKKRTKQRNSRVLETPRKRPLISSSSSQSSSTLTKRRKASVVSVSPHASPSSAVARAAKSKKGNEQRNSRALEGSFRTPSSKTTSRDVRRSPRLQSTSSSNSSGASRKRLSHRKTSTEQSPKPKRVKLADQSRLTVSPQIKETIHSLSDMLGTQTGKHMSNSDVIQFLADSWAKSNRTDLAQVLKDWKETKSSSPELQLGNIRELTRPDIIVPETGASRSSPSLQPESKEQQVAGKSTAVRCAQCVNIRNVMPEFQNNCFCNRP
eukprot:922309_1